MALIKADRVKETSTSETTANFILGGAATGYRTFSSVCVVGDTFHYAIVNQSNGQWEVGIGTYGLTNTLERTTVLSSSNSNAKVNFSAGTKEVFLTASANYLERIIDNGLLTSTGSSTSIVAVNDGPQPQLDLAFSADKTLTARYGPTPSYSRASTGTYFNSSGILTSAAINSPRFDHAYENGAWVSKGLLIEEQRTNLLPYSSELNNTSLFSTSQASVLSNSDICPDGSQSADKLVENTSNSEHGGEYAYVSHSTNTRYTFSTFLKSAGRSIIRVLLANGAYSGNLIAYFDLSSGTVTSTLGSVTASILNVGNGWYRISVGGLTISTISILAAQIRLVNSGTTTVYTGDGSSGMLFWGAQFEVGSFASSYIPTTTTSAVRSADVCQITGSAFTNLWNATEGSIVLEQDLLSYSDPAADQRYFAVAASANNPALTLHYDGGINFYLERYITSGTNLVMPDVSSAYKIALAVKTNDWALSLNGGNPITASSPALPTNFFKIDIGYQVGAAARSSWIQRLRYFRSRLDNQTLVQLSGGINNLVYKTVTGSGNATVTNNYTNINVSVPNPLPLTNGGTGGTSALAAVNNLVGNPPNDGGQYTLASKKTSGTPTFYWVDGTGYAPTLDLLFAADKTLTAYKGPTPSFSRASSGTYFGSDGVLKYANVNTILYSEDFTNAYWVKSGISVSGNSTVAPDGKTTADKIVENSAGGIKYGTVSGGFSVTSGTTYCFSVYLKDSGRYLGFATNSTAFPNAIGAVFNPANGTISNIQPNTTASIQDVGNGWYRCSISGTANASATTNINFGVSNDLNQIYPSYTGNGSSGYFLWGFQMETGSTPGTYVPTTNAANSAPRFDFTYNGTSWISRGLLVEEQRTNSAQYSEDLSNAYWTKFGLSISANNAVAPDGNTTADKAVESAANVQHTLYNSGFSVTSGTAYTISFFAKASGRNFIQFQSANALSGASSGTINFDLANGVLGTVSGTNTSAEIVNIGNGWYRCIVKISSAASTGTGFIQLTLIDSATASFGQAYLGDGTSGVLVWGIQLEASGAFATSYIPSLSNSSATRSADVCQIYGSDFQSFWNASEGSVAVEYDYQGAIFGGPLRIAEAPQGNQSVSLQTSSGNLYCEIYSSTNGGTQASFSASPLAGGVTNKTALAFAANNFAASFNGASTLTDVSGVMPSGVVIAYIGSPGGVYINGHISRLRYYPVRIPNATLQTLST